MSLPISARLSGQKAAGRMSCSRGESQTFKWQTGHHLPK